MELLTVPIVFLAIRKEHQAKLVVTRVFLGRSQLSLLKQLVLFAILGNLPTVVLLLFVIHVLSASLSLMLGKAFAKNVPLVITLTPLVNLVVSFVIPGNSRTPRTRPVVPNALRARTNPLPETHSVSCASPDCSQMCPVSPNVSPAAVDTSQRTMDRSIVILVLPANINLIQENLLVSIVPPVSLNRPLVKLHVFHVLLVIFLGLAMPIARHVPLVPISRCLNPTIAVRLHLDRLPILMVLLRPPHVPLEPLAWVLD